MFLQKYVLFIFVAVKTAIDNNRTVIKAKDAYLAFHTDKNIIESAAGLSL